MDHLFGGNIPSLPIVPYLVEKNHSYDYQGFHTFPGRAGWELGPDGRWEYVGVGQCGQSRDPTPFLQAWLFFGLLAEVLGHDKCEDFRRQTDYSQWIITTETLPSHLDEWRKRLLETEHSSFAPLAIQAGLALDKARSVVMKCCSAPGHDERIDTTVALSLMVLGETLSNSLSGVLKDANVQMSGWYVVSAAGWGVSKELLLRLRIRWCPRSVHILRNVLHHSVCGLLFALYLYDPPHSPLDHKRCSDEQCDASNGAVQATCWMSTEPCQCKYIGPDLERLVKIIEQGSIPLFTYDSLKGEIAVDEEKTSYTIVSHVWSHGLGNSVANKLPQCCVKGLVEAVNRVEGSRQSLICPSGSGRTRVAVDHPFWIDTLAIPVEPKHQALRTKAIQNIHLVYEKAEFTIVVDKGLMSQWCGETYKETAMRISSCDWMTRLWTLQEAYLSKRLYFIFEKGLVEMEDLEKKKKDATKSPLSSAAGAYYQGLLGTQRLRYLSDPHGPIDPDFIAAVSKAVQWRNTTHSRHETLALATLMRFDLSIFDTQLEAPSRLEAQLERLMQSLLEQINLKDAIPSGFIFLPGQKLSSKGFRWAPRSWMTGQELEDPSPLNPPNPSAQLITNMGLQVRYPGFRLHNIGSLEDIDGLAVPTNKLLNTWLSISCSDNRILCAIPHIEQLEIITMSENISSSREIALLVTVQQDRSARIIQRLWVRIENNLPVIEARKEGFRNAVHSSPWVEALPPSTKWYVDGPEPSPESSKSSSYLGIIYEVTKRSLTRQFRRRRESKY